ncbi:MAG: hypothetical protein QNK04_09660 [Myxococcota bacterium]|nr:hypothetical protein [Myxococcota bacterium]
MFGRISLRSLLLVVLVVSLGAPVRAATLYGVGTWDIQETSNLYTIDPATGSASLIGPTGVEALGGIALAFDGTLYAYNLQNLYTLNRSDGSATLVGPLGLRAPEGGLIFQPGTGTLYGVNASISTADELLTIDPTTGAATVVGDLGPEGRDPSGLAFHSDGRLFSVAFKNNMRADDQLITIDPDTAAVTPIGLLGTSVLAPTVGGLAFGPGDSLYFSDHFSLYSVDVDTGAATLIGAHGTGTPMAGLAFIPEPASATLLLAGLLALAARRQSRRR